MLALLRTRFVPVAVDQHIHRQLRDAEGRLFASVLSQAGRGLNGTSQGVYLFTPAGRLLEFGNTADAGQVRRLLVSALRKFDPGAEAPAAGEAAAGKQPVPEPPPGGLVVTVTSKVLGGYNAADPRSKIHAESLGRDHLWVRKDEAESLAHGTLPQSLVSRLARYHLVDNTRGEPPFWGQDGVRTLTLGLDGGRITGTVHLETAAGDRGYHATALGFVETKDDRVTRLDVVFKGEFWGEGPFTRNAPKGRYPFAVALTLNEGTSAADRALPGAARGSVERYLR